MATGEDDHILLIILSSLRTLLQLSVALKVREVVLLHELQQLFALGLPSTVYLSACTTAAGAYVEQPPLQLS